jgi:hypothetical protein
MTDPTPTPRDIEEAERVVHECGYDTGIIQIYQDRVDVVALALARARVDGQATERAGIVAYLRAMVRYALSDGERVLCHGLAECIFRGSYHEPAPGKEGTDG